MRMLRFSWCGLLASRSATIAWRTPRLRRSWAAMSAADPIPAMRKSRPDPQLPRLTYGTRGVSVCVQMHYHREELLPAAEKAPPPVTNVRVMKDPFSLKRWVIDQVRLINLTNFALLLTVIIVSNNIQQQQRDFQVSIERSTTLVKSMEDLTQTTDAMGGINEIIRSMNELNRWVNISASVAQLQASTGNILQQITSLQTQMESTSAELSSKLNSCRVILLDYFGSECPRAPNSDTGNVGKGQTGNGGMFYVLHDNDGTKCLSITLQCS